MRQILRVGLMVLLAAAAGVGSAWGEKKEYTDGNGVTWEYEEIEAGATCSIWPKDKNSISGLVEIPEAVVVNGVSIKVVEIGESAFHGCSGLTAVTIPGSVTQIWEEAFSGCSRLKALEVKSGNKNYCAESGVLFTKDKATLICYPGGKLEESYIIPEGVTQIGSAAFENCSGLKEVTIPSSVKAIGEYAFNGCSGLTAVTIPSSVTVIRIGSFSGCSGLKAVTIPDGVTVIGRYAFEACSGLKAVTIPSSVTEIRFFAFSGCSGLKKVTIPGSVTVIGMDAFSGCSGLKEVTISEGVTVIGGYAFSGCSGLTAVTIPGSVTRIGEYAFYTSGLKEVTISEGVTEIGDAAFYESGLEEVTIPSSVTKIGRWAFPLWLEAVYWLAKANCSVEDNAFEEIASLTLYVRQGEKAAIEANGQTWWKKFDKIEEGYVVTFKNSDGNKLCEQLVKPNNGTVTAPTAPTRKGYTFVEWQLDGKKYDFSKPVTQNITLVAKWKKKEESTPSTPKDPTDPKTAVESVQLAGVRVVRNPVGEVLELEGMERAARVEVYSMVGERVHAEALRGEPRVVIDARGWASGVYLVRVVASDGAKTLRVVR